MLNIGKKIYRNLPEQVAENMKQIGKIWEKLDGLDVYDNVIILEDLDPLTPEQLTILAKPVSFIVYNNNVYMKRGASASQLFFDKVYNVSESSGTVTFASGEITVNYPLGTLSVATDNIHTYSKAELDTLLNGKVDKSVFYPVGSIYLSVDSTSPASIFGGTWEQLKDRFLLGAGDTYTAGDVGGEATHTLTNGEMPAHTHDEQVMAYYGDSSNYNPRTVFKTSGSGSWSNPGPTGFSSSGGVPFAGDNSNPLTTKTSGSGNAHNNMPPYLVVYMWKRTA